MENLKNTWSKTNLIYRGLGLTAMLLILAGLFIAVQPTKVEANSGYLSLAVAKYPAIMSSALNSCSLCHTSSIPALNPYGKDFQSHGDNTASFGSIEAIDSDGDGFTNLQEIQALTFPGDPASHPVQPTATNTSIPTATKTLAPTATRTLVPTQVPPTATKPAPTNTAVPPTPTKPAPTNTALPPTATLPAAPTNTPVPPTAINTAVAPTATQPGPTATQPAPTATQPVPPTAQPGPTQLPGRVVLPAVADTYVNEANPQSNYGGKSMMLVSSRPTMASYLRFDLSSMAGKPIRKILLRMYMLKSTEGSLTVSSIDDHSWDEMGMNFLNAPQAGKALFRTRELHDSEDENSGGYWVVIDVTRYINSAGLWDLKITTRSDEGTLSIGTRETGKYAPQLVFVTNP